MKKDENSFLSTISINESLLDYAKSFNLKRRKDKKETSLTQDSKKLYVIYARKSTTDEGRQQESISSQIQKCQEYAKYHNLEVIDIVREQQSARTSGKREQFNHILETISEGNSYNSILSWHPDRLSRNMKESGEILDLLDKDIIADLKFVSYSFTNDTAGKMTLSMLFAMAKEFSDKLSDDTKRGNERKVSLGKYMGNPKHGYLVNTEDYFRPDTETFELYKQAWQDYLKGIPQKQIVEELQAEIPDINIKKISNIFMDPFYAGIYCYGENIVNLKEVDPKFTPMVSAKEFLSVQRAKKISGGWVNSSKFKPFRHLVTCKDCGNIMTPGLSRSGGNKVEMLYISCRNHKCQATRKANKVKPISNTIRGHLIVDKTITILSDVLKVDKKTYQKVKEEYFKSNNKVIGEMLSESKILKSRATVKKANLQKINDKLLSIDEDVVIKKLSRDMKGLMIEIEEIKKEMKELDKSISEIQLSKTIDFPDYEEFVNFFKNAVLALKTTQNDELVDQIVKLVCVNFTVGDGKVLGYKLNQPFEAYKELKILHGVEDGT